MMPANPLRLSLVPTGAIRYMYGCDLHVPFSDGAEILGLHYSSRQDGHEQEWAGGFARYTVKELQYLCRTSIHVKQDKDDVPGTSCLAIEFLFCPPSGERLPDGLRMPLSAMSAGLQGLAGRGYVAENERTEISAFWTSGAPVIASISAPAEWADGAIIGVQLSDPSQAADAIVQNRRHDDKTHSVATVMLRRGMGLSPRQLVKNYRIMLELANAFQVGDMALVAEKVEDYGAD